MCKVHEVGEVEGKPYIAMQLVVGQALDKAAATMSLAEKVRLLRDAAQALHAAHELGIIHREPTKQKAPSKTVQKTWGGNGQELGKTGFVGRF